PSGTPGKHASPSAQPGAEKALRIPPRYISLEWEDRPACLASRRSAVKRSGSLLPFLTIFCCLLAGPLSTRADESAADESILKSAGLKTEPAALLDFFTKRTLSDNEQANLEAMIRSLGDRSYIVREQATADLIAKGRPAV